MTSHELTDGLRRQLRILKAVYDDPTITGIWDGAECDALVRMGLAERHQVAPHIWVVCITPKGVEVAS